MQEVGEGSRDETTKWLTEIQKWSSGKRKKDQKEEEAGGNLQSKTNCYKCKKNPKYHDGMISVENVRKALDEASKTDPPVSRAAEILHPFRYKRPQRYTCQLSHLRREPHACGLKTSISRRLTPASQFLTPD